MVKEGKEYIPSENLDYILFCITQDAKLNRLIDNKVSLEDRFLEYKKLLIGSNNFVASKDIGENIPNRINDIKNNKIDKESLIYNIVEIYNIANELHHLMRDDEHKKENVENIKLYKNLLREITREGANLEEVKKNIYIDNFLAFNKEENNYLVADLNEYKFENAIGTANVLKMFDKLSPYYAMSNLLSTSAKYPDIPGQVKYLENELGKYDKKMLKSYLDNKVISLLFEILFVCRNIEKGYFLNSISKVVSYHPTFNSSERDIFSRRIYSDKLMKLLQNFSKNGDIDLNYSFNLYSNIVIDLKQARSDFKAKPVLENFFLITSQDKLIKDIMEDEDGKYL